MAKRKKTDIVPLMLRLREGLRKQLESAARAQDRSLNSEIVARLEESFRRAEQAEEAGFRSQISQQLSTLVERFDEEIARRRSASEGPLPERFEEMARVWSRLADEEAARERGAPARTVPYQKTEGTARSKLLGARMTETPPAHVRTRMGATPHAREAPPNKPSSLEERLRLRAEELAAQGRREDAATLRFMIGRPLPRPLPRYLLDLLDQDLIDLLDLLDQEPELPMPQPRNRLSK
jgi:hypothetical protein